MTMLIDNGQTRIIGHSNYWERSTSRPAFNVYNPFIKKWSFKFEITIPSEKCKYWDNASVFFIGIPKTGTRSITYSIPNKWWIKYDYCHMYGKHYPTHIREKLKTIVRNPYDRLVSAYFFITRGGFFNNREFRKIKTSFSSFDDWVLNGLSTDQLHCATSSAVWEPLHLQADWILDDNNRLVLPQKNIGRFETIEEDSKRLFGINDLAKLNCSERKPWQEYYHNPKVANKVYLLYRKDFRLLGYPKYHPNDQ